MVWGKCGTYFKVVSGVQIFGVCMYVLVTYMGGRRDEKKVWNVVMSFQHRLVLLAGVSVFQHKLGVGNIRHFVVMRIIIVMNVLIRSYQIRFHRLGEICK